MFGRGGGSGMKQLFLGIDAGTSAMKIVLTDEERKVHAQVTEEYCNQKPMSGFNEIDPELWVESMERGLRKILSSFDRSLIKGIGITGQMHTLIVLDEKGDPIRPAIMWNDTRARELIPCLRKKIASFQEGEYLSKTISTGSPAANLYWLKENEPENFRKIRKFLIGPDYLCYRLTGAAGTDYCEASTSCLYEIIGKRWSVQMREFLGLEEQVYPRIRGSAVSAGNLMASMAARLGLSGEIPVYTGTGDNPATALSTGCLMKGYPVVSLGTSGVLMMPVQTPDPNARGKVILFSFDGNQFQYLVQGTVQSNGSTVDWWLKDILENGNYQELDRLSRLDKRAAGQVLFYPHLMGEKTLYGDPDIRGAFVGLGIDTDRDTLLYAVIEGLCFSLRELAEKMKLPIAAYGKLKAVGGGSRSPVWMQILANVMNIRVERMDGNIGPAYGIALLAACGAKGMEKVKEDFCFAPLEGNYYEPDPAGAAACEEKYRKFLRLRRGLKYIETGGET